MVDLLNERIKIIAAWAALFKRGTYGEAIERRALARRLDEDPAMPQLISHLDRMLLIEVLDGSAYRLMGARLRHESLGRATASGGRVYGIQDLRRVYEGLDHSATSNANRLALRAALVMRLRDVLDECVHVREMERIGHIIETHAWNLGLLHLCEHWFYKDATRLTTDRISFWSEIAYRASQEVAQLEIERLVQFLPRWDNSPRPLPVKEKLGPYTSPGKVWHDSAQVLEEAARFLIRTYPRVPDTTVRTRIIEILGNSLFGIKCTTLLDSRNKDLVVLRSSLHGLSDLVHKGRRLAWKFLREAHDPQVIQHVSELLQEVDEDIDRIIEALNENPHVSPVVTVIFHASARRSTWHPALQRMWYHLKPELRAALEVQWLPMSPDLYLFADGLFDKSLSRHER
jgi:hypothetical protein